MLASLCLLSLSPKMWITKSNLFWALHGALWWMQLILQIPLRTYCTVSHHCVLHRDTVTMETLRRTSSIAPAPPEVSTQRLRRRPKIERPMQ